MSLAIKKIVKTRGAGVDISFSGNMLEFSDGRLTAVLGANGSGKTTFLEAILGVRTDYDVERSVFGSAAWELPNDVKLRMGVSTQVHSFSEGVVVKDIVLLHAKSYGVPVNDTLLRQLDLNTIGKSLYAKISGGQKKRISLYFALAHDPDLCILDEPEAGLDVQGIETLLEHIGSRSKRGKTTVVATHSGMTTKIAQDVVFLAAGKIVFSGEKSRFIQVYLGEQVLEVDIHNLSQEELEQIGNVGSTRCHEGTGKDKMLIFGGVGSFLALQSNLDSRVNRQSILRDIKSTDLLTWINNRTAQ